MDQKKILLLSQLVLALDDDLKKLEESYAKKDVEKTKIIKEEMLTLQKKIEEVSK